MSHDKRGLPRHSDEQQKEYERIVRLEHGPDLVNESVRRWESYTEEQREAIMAEGNAIYVDMADAIDAGLATDSDEVQAILKRWHAHLHHFYEPPLELLSGLAETYRSHPDFIKNFKAIHPELPDFLHESITHYVDELETAVLEQMLADDEARTRRLSL